MLIYYVIHRKMDNLGKAVSMREKIYKDRISISETAQ